MGDTCDSLITYNISNNADAWLYDYYDRINVLVVNPVIIGVGILTNLAFLYTVMRITRMQTVTNYYLSALAICDIIILASSPPLLIASYIRTPGPGFHSLKTATQCICVYAITAAGYYTSLAVISMVTSERYLAMCSSRYMAIAGKARTLKILLGSLAFGIIFAMVNVPSFAVSSTFCVIWPDEERFADMDTKGYRCGPVSFTYYIYQEFFSILIFIIALCYNGILYIKIVVALSSRSVITESSSTTQPSKVRNQVARLLILNGVIFFVCQSPYRIVTTNRITTALFNASFLSRDVAGTLDIVGQLMLYINSAINPTLYILTSRFYRSGIAEALGFGRCLSREQKGGNFTGVSAVPSVAETEGTMSNTAL